MANAIKGTDPRDIAVNIAMNVARKNRNIRNCKVKTIAEQEREAQQFINEQRAEQRRAANVVESPRFSYQSTEYLNANRR